jgi:50S ribosomal subunit-associated GTPase HflX
VDISVPTQIPQAALELFNIMRDEFMRDKPKLILLNKMQVLNQAYSLISANHALCNLLYIYISICRDAPCSLSDQMLRAYLRFDELLSDNDTKSQVIKISALTGENMNTVLQWISHRMGMKVAPRYSIFSTTKQESRIYPS